MNTLAVVFALLTQTPPAPSLVSVQSTVAWNEVKLNVAGGPTLIAGYDLAVLPSGGDLNLDIDVPIRELFFPASSFQGTKLTALLERLPEGPHRLQVRAINQASLVSAWSIPLDIQITSTGPAVPTGLKVMIQITVGG